MQPSRILLVEDNPDHALVASRVLERAGFSVRVAENGELGIGEALSGNFDLVLLDYGLPDMDGLHVLEAILGAGSPVVFVTGRADAKLAVNAMRMGAINYIVKDAHYVSKLPEVASSTLTQLRDPYRIFGWRVLFQDPDRQAELQAVLGRTLPSEALIVRHQSGDYLVLARESLPPPPSTSGVDIQEFSLDAKSDLAAVLQGKM